MNISQSLQSSFYKSLSKFKARNDMMYILITVLALAAFEAFNFSTTDFALSDLLGDLRFMGLRWSTLLSVAFCGIDFVGIARLFAPQSKSDQKVSLWYLFGAWFLTATMNAILTWWGVVMAMETHPVLSESLMGADNISKASPIFIALMVWIIRVLLIGTLSKKRDRLLGDHQKSQQQTMSRREFRQAQSQAAHANTKISRSVPVGFSKVVRNNGRNNKMGHRPEPNYIPMQDEPVYQSMKAAGQLQSRR